MNPGLRPCILSELDEEFLKAAGQDQQAALDAACERALSQGGPFPFRPE
ncbi:hypothetical protein [Streptomyces sp. NPDC059788]